MSPHRDRDRQHIRDIEDEDVRETNPSDLQRLAPYVRADERRPRDAPPFRLPRAIAPRLRSRNAQTPILTRTTDRAETSDDRTIAPALAVALVRDRSLNQAIAQSQRIAIRSESRKT